MPIPSTAINHYYLDVLNVQKQLLDAQSNLERSKATADTNLLTLCKVLGGGWESTYANPYDARREALGPTGAAGPPANQGGATVVRPGLVTQR